MILINGEYRDHIEISDRGFQYGDGLFETIEVKNGRTVFLNRHLHRLQTGCSRLYIPCPDAELIRSEAAALCKNSPRAVLKIILTRGSGGRGYRQPEALQPTRVLSLHPYPNYPDRYRQQGIAVRLCRTRLGINPSLAGIKHLNRLEQVLARAEWDDPEIQEGLMLDTNDHVIEGTMTNLFYFSDNAAFTPALTYSGVAGIVRGILMDLLRRRRIAVHETVLTADELSAADEVFVCNSIIGIWPVQAIENRRYAVGPLTRQCQFDLNEYKKEAANDE
jgi:4-amino-4-deoxychorismate lyase